MKHIVLFYEIICFSSGLPVIALILANYLKRKSPLLKCLLFYIVAVSIQFLLANILYYREINILYPVTYVHLVLTLCYFLSEASFVFLAPRLIALMLNIPARVEKRVFLILAIVSAVLIVSPYSLGFDPVERAMYALPGLIAYRFIFYAANIYLIVIILKSYRTAEKRLRAILSGSLVLIAVSSIETLFCKLAPVLHAPDFMFRASPLVYLVFNFVLLRFLFKQLTAIPGSAPSFEDIAAAYKITDREKEIILLVLEGYNNSRIGKMLFISEATVKTHIMNIYQKLGVNNRVQLARVFYNR